MKKFNNPVITDAEGQDHGDPFVLRYLDRYYLYHSGTDGVRCYTSVDLVQWRYEGIVLKPSSAPDHWAQVDLWAPEVMYRDGLFYMYVAATRLTPKGKGDDFARRQGITRSRGPLGPFVWDPQPLVEQEWSIDGHPFQDINGQTWLFYNIRTEATRYKDGTIGCGNVVDRLLEPDRLEGKQSPVTFPTERWEGNRDGTWYWNEAPFVLRRRGVYYQMYSGGCYADDTYNIGVATAPSPRGPWRKYPGNPICRITDGILGPGHHCVVMGPDGVTPYAVFHGYVPGERGRKIHIGRFFWAGDHPEIEVRADAQSFPPEAILDTKVPHWQISAWIKGESLAVGEVTIPLASPNYHHVRTIHRRLGAATGELEISVDCVRVYTGPVFLHIPKIIIQGGEVHSLKAASCLDDENTYHLTFEGKL